MELASSNPKPRDRPGLDAVLDASEVLAIWAAAALKVRLGRAPPEWEVLDPAAQQAFRKKVLKYIAAQSGPRRRMWQARLRRALMRGDGPDEAVWTLTRHMWALIHDAIILLGFQAEQKAAERLAQERVAFRRNFRNRCRRASADRPRGYRR